MSTRGRHGNTYTAQAVEQEKRLTPPPWSPSYSLLKFWSIILNEQRFFSDSAAGHWAVLSGSGRTFVPLLIHTPAVTALHPPRRPALRSGGKEDSYSGVEVTSSHKTSLMEKKPCFNSINNFKIHWDVTHTTQSLYFILLFIYKTKLTNWFIFLFLYD